MLLNIKNWWRKITAPVIHPQEPPKQCFDWYEVNRGDGWIIEKWEGRKNKVYKLIDSYGFEYGVACRLSEMYIEHFKLNQQP